MSPEEIAALPYRPCVGVMLVNPAGQVFTGQRIDRDHAAWQMPQGGIDAGEDVRTAALRELREETGVTADKVRIEAVTRAPIAYDLPPEVVPTIWKGRFRGQSQTWVLLRFLGTDADIDLDRPHPEFAAWRWSAPDDLVSDIVPFKRAVYVVSSRIRRPDMTTRPDAALLLAPRPARHRPGAQLLSPGDRVESGRCAAGRCQIVSRRSPENLRRENSPPRGTVDHSGRHIYRTDERPSDSRDFEGRAILAGTQATVSAPRW